MNSLQFATILMFAASSATAAPAPPAPPKAVSLAVGPQYATTHVYVAPNQVDALAASFIATFGGSATTAETTHVTPADSSTVFEAATTPVGLLSIFGYQTPIPYPFGEERGGYMVRDLDSAIAAARQAGAEVVVAPFWDPIGRDAIIRWPGGVEMQLYMHTAQHAAPALATKPENRVYVSSDKADAFVRAFTVFSGGHVIADEAKAPGIEIGRPADTYRRIRLGSEFGRITVLVTDGHLPWPYGRELTGYEVANLAETLHKAKGAGVELLAGPYSTTNRQAALVRFPGGYIAEIHSVSGP